MKFLLTFYLIGSIIGILIFHYGAKEAIREDLITDEPIIINLAYVFVFLGSWIWLIFLFTPRGGLDE